MTNPNDFAFNDSETRIKSVNEDGGKEYYQPPLTKREYFAAMAMQGLITNGWDPSKAETCVKAAKELINALNQDNEQYRI